MHELERKKYEARIEGRQISRVIWSDRPSVGQPADANQIAGFELDGGEIISFSASDQVGVDVVWLDIEDLMNAKMVKLMANPIEQKTQAPRDPNYTVTWKPTRPDFGIAVLRGTSTNRGYHETWFEVISRTKLDADDLKRLDACGLIGIGQVYYLESSDLFDENVPPVTVDMRTGKVVPDVPPVNVFGEPIVSAYSYSYYRYVVKRICDSGD